MAKQNIDLGTQGTQSGDTVRTAFSKTKSNFDELYGDNLAAKLYSGDDGSNWYTNSSTSSWVYCTPFGDTLPAGTYILMGRGHYSCNNLGSPSDLIARVHIYTHDGTNLAAINSHVMLGGLHTFNIIDVVTLTVGKSIKFGILKRSGTGEVKAGYFRWYAIKVK
ncbi:MAG: hypothetical protein U5N56_00050 [Candidatus Marinimicrobia bacterium]|nr:hypothetical protein [Candidatus Neomarinimicrobiota bacterium]